MVQSIDLAQAEYVENPPIGAEVGIACRTSDGGWFFIKEKLGDKVARNIDTVSVFYPQHFGLCDGVLKEYSDSYVASDLPVFDESKGVLSVSKEICTKSCNPVARLRKSDGGWKVSMILFVHIASGNISSSKSIGFITAGKTIDFYVSTSKVINSYLSISSAGNTAYLSSVNFSLSSVSDGWHCIHSVNSAKEDGSGWDSEIFLDGVSMGINTMSTNISSVYGLTNIARSDYKVDGDEAFSVGFLCIKNGGVSTQEVISMFDEFKSENSL